MTDDTLDRLDGIAVDDSAPMEEARVFGVSELRSLTPLYPEGVERLLT